MRPLFLAPALVLAALAAPAAAQSWSDPGLAFGAHLSASSGESAEGVTAGGGLFLRYRMTGSLALEGGVAYRRETLGDAGGPLLDVLDVPVTGTGLLYFLPRTRVQPYLLAGAGLHVVQTKPAGRNATTQKATEAQFAMHAGAGIDFRPSRRSSVHLDARWFFFEPTAVSDLAADGYGVGGGYLLVSLGVSFSR